MKLLTKLLPLLILLISLLNTVHAKPIPAAELFRDSTLSQLQFSPNGQHISLFVNFADGKGLALFDQKSNNFQLIAMVAQTDWIRHYRWLDDQNLYLISGRGNLWIHSIVHLEQTQGRIKATVTAIPANGYLVGQLAGQPTQLLFATNVGRHEVEFQLYQLSVAELLSSKFPPAGRIKGLLHTDAATRLHYDTASNRLISIRMDREAQQFDLQYRALDQAKWQPLFRYNPAEFSFMPLAFINDTSLAVLSDKNNDKMALYRFDLGSQQFGELLFEHPRYDLIDADFAAGKLASVSYLAHGRLEQQFFTDEQQQLQQALAGLFKRQQWKVVASDAGRHLLLVFSASNPGQYYLYTPKQKPQLIGDLLPELAPYSMAETVKLQAKSADGMAIESLLTLPAGAGKTTPPLIVMPHGGPIGVQDTDEFDPTVQFLASRGYAVLRTNFRGSSGYGKSFSQRGVAELGAGIEQDINRALQQVRQQYGISRACAMGYSYGGYSAMMLAMHQPQFYRCVVAGYGIYDLPLLFNASNLKVQPEQQKRVENVVGPQRADLKLRSPVYKAAMLQAPALIIAGMEDDIAGFEQSHRMVDALKRAGKPVEQMFYQDTGHGHSRWDLEHHQIGLIEQFLNRHLPGSGGLSQTEQAEQWYRQAQLLSSGDTLTKDLPAAIKLYQQAAAAGHSAAMVALADAALTGKGLPKNVAEAIKHLEMASVQQNADAEFMLGTLHSSGLYLKADHVKANQHFKAAAKLEPNNIATLYLARAACRGFTEKAQWTGCLDQIVQHLRRYHQHENDRHSKLLQQTMKEIVAELLIDAAPPPEARNRLIQMLQHTMPKPLDITAEVNEYRSGLYSGTGVKYAAADTYPLSSKAEFGSTLKVARADDSAHPAGWILVRWERQLANGQTQQLVTMPMAVALSDRLQLHALLSMAPDQQAAIWHLQVYNLNGEKLYQQQFNFQ